MTATVTSLNHYRQEHERINQIIQEDLDSLFFEWHPATIVEEIKYWLDVAREIIFQPLYGIQEGRHERRTRRTMAQHIRPT